MKKISFVFALLLVSFSLFAANPVPAFITAHTPSWTSDLILYNGTGVDQTFAYTSLQISPNTLLLKSGSTKLLLDFALSEPKDVAGFGIFPVDNLAVHSTMSYTFNDGKGHHAFFELDHPLVNLLNVPGDHVTFTCLRNDSVVQTVVTSYNKGPNSTSLTVQVVGPNGDTVGSELFFLPLGISQNSLVTQLPGGGKIVVTEGVSLALDPSRNATIYLFAVVSPPNGTTQAVRYPE